MKMHVMTVFSCFLLKKDEIQNSSFYILNRFIFTLKIQNKKRNRSPENQLYLWSEIYCVKKSMHQNACNGNYSCTQNHPGFYIGVA